MATSQQTGMGAIHFAGGTGFRVWAPFAASVHVAGAFNAWDPQASPLESEGNGFWSGDIATAGPGDEYKFVISNATVPGALWKNDPYAKSMTNSAGNSIITSTEFPWQAHGYTTPAWNEMIIYEVHVGSFLFDPSTQNGRGDFTTVIGKLDYLVDLGINAIQVMPSDEFPGTNSFGYNPADIFAIESNYGGPNGFQALVDAAHLRGIAVIYDVVYNHLGPNDLDLWRFDGWSENGAGGIYFYNDWRRSTPWGDTRPDYGREEVRQFLRDNALFWLEQHQCDGLRFDATGWIRNVWGDNNDQSADVPDGWSLLQRINNEIRARQPLKITIAEDMRDNEWVTKPPPSGGAGFAAQWGAGFVHTVRKAATTVDDNDRDMAALATIIEQRFNSDAFERIVYSESHDEDAASNGNARLPEQIWPGNANSFAAQKRSTLVASLVFTSPGIPMVFMGQEFLEAGAWTDAQQLDWSKADDFSGIRMLYRDLIRLRRDWFDNTRGLCGQGVHVHHVNNQDKVIAWHRWYAGGPRDDVLVIANFANRSYDAYRIGLPRGGAWRVRFNGDWSGYSNAFTNHPSYHLQTNNEPADTMRFSGSVGLGPYTAVILSQDD